MANFKTHLTASIVASSLVVSVALSLRLVDQNEVIILWLLGILGGLLPDIDSDNSATLQLVFNISAVFSVLFLTQWLSPVLSIVGLWVAGATVFILIRYVLIKLFAKFTVHRGSLHSLLACGMFGLVGVHLSLWFGADYVFACCAGISIALGGLVHLALDEYYSVDFSNMAIKRSFGSALKLCSRNYPLATTTQLISCAGMLYLLPLSGAFIAKVKQAPINILSRHDLSNLQRFIDYSLNY